MIIEKSRKKHNLNFLKILGCIIGLATVAITSFVTTIQLVY